MNRSLKLTILLLFALIIALSTYLLWPTTPPLTPPVPSPTPSSLSVYPPPTTSSLSPTPYPYPSEFYEQGELDYHFNTLVQETYQQYPFIIELPISTDQYTILFDFETNSIRVRLHNATQQQVSTQVIQQLQSIGVDTTKIPIKYVQ